MILRAVILQTILSPGSDRCERLLISPAFVFLRNAMQRETRARLESLPKQKRRLSSRWTVYRYRSCLKDWVGSGNSYVARHITPLCGARCYVALGTRLRLGMHVNGPERHIISSKGFAGTALARRPFSNASAERRGSRRLRALWPSSLDRLRRKRL